MTLTVEQLDTLPAAEAAFKLAACCGSKTWIARMVAKRPYGSRDGLFAAAEDVARTLQHGDWLDAFAHHPRIGEKNAAAHVSADAASWASNEQSAASTADRDVQTDLAAANAEYEKRFGFIFIVSANGRSAEQILSALRERLSNDSHAEIFVAAREQQKITRLRLEKLVPKVGGRA